MDTLITAPARSATAPLLRPTVVRGLATVVAVLAVVLLAALAWSGESRARAAEAELDLLFEEVVDAHARVDALEAPVCQDPGCPDN